MSGTVPSDSFRAQVAAHSPVLVPILNAYPEGQSPTSNPDVDQFTSEGTQVVNEDSGMFRLDHRFSDKTTVFARANIDEAVNTQPLPQSGTSNYLFDQQQLASHPVNAGIELLHIFSPTFVNEAKFGFNRSTAFTTNVNQTGLLYAFSISDPTGSFTTLNTYKANTGVGNSFAGIDNATWVKGRHVAKAGVEIRRIPISVGLENAFELSQEPLRSETNSSSSHDRQARFSRFVTSTKYFAQRRFGQLASRRRSIRKGVNSPM